MPSAPKLIAALFFAALAWLTCDLIKPGLPEGTPVGLFSPVTAGLGLVLGWRFTGRGVERAREPGRGYGLGLATSLLLVFWGLIIWSGNEMLRRSMRKAYDGAFDALQGMMEIAVKDLTFLARLDVAVVLILGGVLGGWLTERVSPKRRL